ncbi:MAG TPA: isoprenylcysteine carboxylmethyltransferase family protein, partial [Candidatus Limnocylindrales bacterium]|nr:isoprenylcysteine carboxylmethyltransferase family protein [Candidatus Limnocylindrales bacterium]
MKATDWEFSNRAMLFGLVFGLTFSLYSLDHQNATAAFANWAGAHLNANIERIARVIFVLATLAMAGAALLRTWASAFLHSGIVYAAEVKSAVLVAEGPYRRVRNPLYFGNIIMAVAMGKMMSRLGFLLCLPLMWLFCYRLI